jgi:Uma2 family endonuclease
VAEVVSPGDHANELNEKVGDYLRGGVKVVWVVYPISQQMHAFPPGSNQIRVYFAADELDAGDILPGFRTPVAPLFPPVEVPPPGPSEE